jgi:hypothetical protein
MQMLTLSIFHTLACSGSFQKEGDEVNISPTSEPTEEPSSAPTAEPSSAPTSEPTTETPDDCLDGPEETTLTPLTDCTYAPSPTGTPFSAKIEWGMSHELIDPASGDVVPSFSFSEESSMTGTFQAPVVGNLTDDNQDGLINDKDVPDIAIVMGDEFGDDSAVIRLISGRGDIIHDTIGWSSFQNNTYAPAIFAGLATGDIDGDGLYELVTMVTESDLTTCHPATYEIASDGTLSLESVSAETLWCNILNNSHHAAHTPSLGDIDGDGNIEVLFGDSVYEGNDLSLRFVGGSGAGWFNSWFEYPGGYWNSGYHSFFYDIDGDGSSLELISGKTIYNNDGSVYCELETEKDGYPAIADISISTTGPEIVLTANEDVSLFSSVSIGGICSELDVITNSPYEDSNLAPLLAAEHPDCNTERRSFGGPATIADFDGDGEAEIGVSGACWYTIYKYTNSGGLFRYAMAQTRDWSSASTGSTVFDFDGDDRAEIVFADEDALYIWGFDETQNNPWEKLVPYLIDDNHKSWTIHEYPIVADIDGDGKAEILVLNSPRPDYMDEYGFYVLGAADDNWVSARKWWNQHAYYVTNIEDDGSIGVASPNYAPYYTDNLNSFRQQAPGIFGEKAAPNLFLEGADPCQTECGDFDVWIQVGNEGAFITASSGLYLSLYGITGNSSTLIDTIEIPFDVFPATLSDGIHFTVSNWSTYDLIEAVIDDPSMTPDSWGFAKECDETDNKHVIYLQDLCE